MVLSFRPSLKKHQSLEIEKLDIAIRVVCDTYISEVQVNDIVQRNSYYNEKEKSTQSYCHILKMNAVQAHLLNIKIEIFILNENSIDS